MRGTTKEGTDWQVRDPMSGRQRMAVSMRHHNEGEGVCWTHRRPKNRPEAPAFILESKALP